MPKPARFDPYLYLTLADRLLMSLGEIEEQDWVDQAPARLRASISRVYYSLFLTLKDRIERVDSDPKLWDSRQVHRCLRVAVGKVLGDRHVITLALNTLVRRRADSDYELGMEITSKLAEDSWDEAESAIALAEKLSSPRLQSIANRMRAVI